METVWMSVLRWHAALLGRASPGGRDDRGDVPGWVLVTMMTVGLVIAITQIATDQLGDILRSALNRVR